MEVSGDAKPKPNPPPLTGGFAPNLPGKAPAQSVVCQDVVEMDVGFSASAKPSGDSPVFGAIPTSTSPLIPPADSFVFKTGSSSSFRDRVVGGSLRPEIAPMPDLLEEKLASVSLMEGDRLRPSVSFASSVMERLSAPWEGALIVKVLGLKIGFGALRMGLCKLWKLPRGFELLDLGHGFFLAKFDCEADREVVINGGPWMLYDHYVAVSRWTPEFSSETCKIMKTLVWIRLPVLRLMYYNEAALRVIASAVGKPVKVDTNTLEISRGRYARICIEIDLELPVVSSLLLNGEWQKVEYEGLHLICSNCGRYGHGKKECSGKSLVESGAVEGESVEQVQSDNNLGMEVMGADGSEEGNGMGDVVGGSVPPQPELGEWVTVSRRNKGNRGKKAVTDRKEGQSMNPSNSSPRVLAASAKRGVRNLSAGAVNKSQQRSGNGVGHQANEQKGGSEKGHLPGLKRHRSTGVVDVEFSLQAGAGMEQPVDVMKNIESDGAADKFLNG